MRVSLTTVGFDDVGLAIVNFARVSMIPLSLHHR